LPIEEVRARRSHPNREAALLTRLSRNLTALYSMAILMGVFALFRSPRPALAEQCWWECEKCTCDVKTEVCQCTNCKMGCNSPE
jgi:hypothetical protein